MTLQKRFNAFYSPLALESLGDLDTIYDSQVTFVDPVAVHIGLGALDGYFRRLLTGCSRCDFVIREQVFGETQGWLNWTMTFANPRLNGGRDIEVDGSSVLAICDDRITFQRDYYDLGAMLYEQIPVLGGLIRHIRGRLAA